MIGSTTCDWPFTLFYFKMNPIFEKYFNENERLLNTEDFYDVKIHVGVEPNIKEVHAHASIISAHCQFFSNELSNATKENGYYIVKKANISEKLFKPILK